jgi:hypothetical protein
MRLTVREAIQGDLMPLSRAMRKADEDEVMASGGFGPLRALTLSFRASFQCRTLLVDEEPAAMWGVMPLPQSGVGAAWLLTSTLVDTVPTAFLRISIRELARMRRGWSELFNYVDARHTVALRWAAWLGFDVGEPQPFGVSGLPFHRIHIPGIPKEESCVSR